MEGRRSRRETVFEQETVSVPVRTSVMQPDLDSFIIRARFALHMEVLLGEFQAFRAGDESEEGLPLSLARMNAVLSGPDGPALEEGETEEEAREAVRKVLEKISVHVEALGIMKATIYRKKVYEASYVVFGKLKRFAVGQTVATKIPCLSDFFPGPRNVDLCKALEKRATEAGLPGGVGNFIGRMYSAEAAERKIEHVEKKWKRIKVKQEITKKLKFNPALIGFFLEATPNELELILTR